MYVCIHNNTNNILLLKAGLGHTKSSNAQDVFRQMPGLIHVCMHVHVLALVQCCNLEAKLVGLTKIL